MSFMLLEIRTYQSMVRVEIVQPERDMRLFFLAKRLMSIVNIDKVER